MTDIFFRTLIIGLAIAAPVGPIGVLCVNRSLAKGFLSGFLTGLGAASADAVFALVAVFGLSAMTSLLVQYQWLIKIIGGVFLVYLGIKLFLPTHPDKQLNRATKGLRYDYVSAFLLTVANPMTILSFIAIFAGVGVTVFYGKDIETQLIPVMGVFIGSLLWWFFLSGFSSIFNKKVKAVHLRWINIFSGVVILFFGVFSLYSAISKFL